MPAGTADPITSDTDGRKESIRPAHTMPPALTFLSVSVWKENNIQYVYSLERYDVYISSRRKKERN